MPWKYERVVSRKGGDHIYIYILYVCMYVMYACLHTHTYIYIYSRYVYMYNPSFIRSFKRMKPIIFLGREWGYDGI